MKCGGCNEMPQRCTHTLTVEKPGAAVDAAGQPDLATDASWVTVGQIRARAVTRGGKEAYVFKQTQADTENVFFSPSTALSRSLHDHPEWRLRDGSYVYEITYSDLINKTGKEVIIEVKEAV